MKDRINATLARRLATASEARKAAFAASYSRETFALWIASARRCNALRSALLGRIESQTSNRRAA